MFVSIKSEVDSRIILYPMIRALWSFGSVAVITSNRQLRRLINGDNEGDFRGVTIIVDEEGASDDIYETYGIREGTFDYIILDNMGVIEYDACVIPVGLKHSANFDEDVKMMLLSEDSKKVYVVQFGKSSKDARKQNKKESRQTKGQTRVTEENYDPAEKFRDKVVDDKKRGNNRIINCKFPSYKDIEQVEAEHKFPEIDIQVVTALYDIFKDVVCVDSNQFRKEVQKKDEYSAYIESTNTVGSN